MMLAALTATCDNVMTIALQCPGKPHRKQVVWVTFTTLPLASFSSWRPGTQGGLLPVPSPIRHAVNATNTASATTIAIRNRLFLKFTAGLP